LILKRSQLTHRAPDLTIERIGDLVNYSLKEKALAGKDVCAG